MRLTTRHFLLMIWSFPLTFCSDQPEGTCIDICICEDDGTNCVESCEEEYAKANDNCRKAMQKYGDCMKEGDCLTFACDEEKLEKINICHADEFDDDDDDNDDNPCKFSVIEELSFKKGTKLIWSDDCLYGLNDEKLAVFDVRTPTSPLPVAEIEEINNSDNVAADKDWIYLVASDQRSRLSVYDWNEKTEDPKFVREIEIDQPVDHIVIAGEFAILAADDTESDDPPPMLIYALADLNDKETTATPSEFPVIGAFSALAISEKTLYCGFQNQEKRDVEHQLLILDVSSAQTPEELAAVEAPGRITAIAPAEERIYTSIIAKDREDEADMAIFSSARTSDPELLGTFADGTKEKFGLGVAQHGDYAYLIVGKEEKGALYAIDVSSPKAPFEFDQYEHKNEFFAIYQVTNDNGKTLFLTDKNNILDLFLCKP